MLLGRRDAAVWRKLRMLRCGETAVVAVGATGGAAHRCCLVGSRPFSVSLLERAPWVLGSTAGQRSTRRRQNTPPPHPDAAKANKHGGSAFKAGAIPLMGGGGAERLAGGPKPRRLAGGAGEAAAVTGPSGQSWGAELGGGGAELAQRPNLHGWRCRRARSFTEMPGRNAGARNWRRHEVGALPETALKASYLSELRKTDDQGLIDWCPPVMRDTHPKD